MTGPLTVSLVALVSISGIVSVMLGVAWHDLGRPVHARTWSAAFALTALTWLLPFAHALNLIGVGLTVALMPGLAGFASVCIACGFRQRAGLPDWIRPLGALAAAHFALQLLLGFVGDGASWVVPLTALNAAMFALSARTLRGRRRGERAAERVAEAALALLTLLNLVVLAGMIGAHAGVLTIRADQLRLATVVLLPGIIAAIGLFTIILLTADLADQTRRQAATDMLTGLLNRRGFDLAARAVLAAARRGRRQVALVLIDVDHFKSINDRYGHPAGDRALRQFADCLGQGVARRDVFARIGGEEFALVMMDVDIQAAACAVEVLRLQVETLTLDLPDPPPVTASFGLASLASEEALADLFLRADRALYRSKEAGRNRVTVAG